MPAVSFSGTTSLGAFWLLIRKGLKFTTMRTPRKNPIKEGDRLYLYWRQRTPAKDKPVHYIADAICVSIARVAYIDFANDLEMVRSEGFGSKAEMWEWFGPPQCTGTNQYDRIMFQVWPYCPYCGEILVMHKHGDWICQSDQCHDPDGPDFGERVIAAPWWYELASMHLSQDELPEYSTEPNSAYLGEGRIPKEDE